jgi:hypothetical protein
MLIIDCKKRGLFIYYLRLRGVSYSSIVLRVLDDEYEN